MTIHSEQLEREAEDSRLRLERTLNDLRILLTPGQMIDKALHYAREGAPAEFLHNLRHEVLANPLPVAMAGAGLAWMMFANARTAQHRGNGDGRAAEGMRDMAHGASEGAGHLADSAAETAASLRASAAETVSSVRKTAGEATAKLRSGGQAVSHSATAAAQFGREHPMVLLGLGLAAGAVLGAILPASEAENRLTGEGSDRLKESVAETAREQLEKAEHVGEAAYAAARQEAEEQGLVAESPSQPVAEHPTEHRTGTA
jgi:ElaB/YqjD/DUF883 family membrane-anchored ribosome-binding protein